jgi:hypothetical protein
MKRWTLAVSVLALLVAMGAGALTGGVLYMDRPAAVAALPVAHPLVNSSQLCLGYRSQVLTMRLRGVYAKQMIDIFNLEMVTMNSKGQLLANRSPAYDYFYKGACGTVKQIVTRLPRYAHHQ